MSKQDDIALLTTIKDAVTQYDLREHGNSECLWADRHKGADGLLKNPGLKMICINGNETVPPHEGHQLKITIQNGAEVCMCRTCGLIEDFGARIGYVSPTVGMVTDTAPEALQGSTSDDLPEVMETAEPETIVAVAPPPVEPEPEVEPAVIVEPVGREPGSDDEPTAIPPVEPAKDAPRFKFKPISEVVMQHPGMRTWWMRGYVPAAAVILIYGDPACGKTTIAVDVDCSIATGSPWRGVESKQGKILYVAAEDYYGARLRIEAWFERNQLKPDNIDILDIPIVLAEESDVELLINIINSMPVKPASITIDTLALSMGKYSENNDMQLFCNGATKIKTQTGITVIVIHHCGHGDKGRSRGGSQLPANADVIFQVERKDDICTMKCQKMKNGIEPGELSWTMETQRTRWADEDGMPITSVVLHPTDNPEPEEKPKKPSQQQELALNVLRDLVHAQETNLLECGFDPAGARVRMSDWQAAMVKVIPAKSSRSRIYEYLIKKELVIEDGLFVRLGSHGSHD